MMARNAIKLIVRQQPTRAQVVQENNHKNRKPIDPPPIIELKYDDREDPNNSQWLVSPRTFMMVTLIDVKDGEEVVAGRYLIGQTVSSLHRLKDINNKDGGFFVFGDISARKLGDYRLRFSLFDTNKDTDEVMYMGSVDSEQFPVLSPREFGSMSESTGLTRAFSDQGVKLRVRKDNRAISSISNKRSYTNTSPPETTSPSIHSGIYGGAVQDHYATTGQSPESKRHRSTSEYDATSHLYATMPLGENSSLSHYSQSTIPSTSRSWGSQDHSRSQSSYGHHSPISMSMINRVPSTLSMSTPTNWQGVNPQGALQSPSQGISGQQSQHTYPNGSAQHSSSALFGDPGSAASSIPRHYYSNSYQYQSRPYQGHHSGDTLSQYSDLQLSGTPVTDGSNLVSASNHGYGQNFMQTGSIFSSDASEVPSGYAYMEGSNQKY